MTSATRVQGEAPFGPLQQAIEEIGCLRIAGRISAIQGSLIEIEGLYRLARLGDHLILESGSGRQVEAEILRLSENRAQALAYGRATGLAQGDRAWLVQNHLPRPDESWIGTIVDAFGQRMGLSAAADNAQAASVEVTGSHPWRRHDLARWAQGARELPIDRLPPSATTRRPLGARLHSGYAALDTMLPICRGQRLGLFAVPGVGKSMLLGGLARRMQADMAVIGLIGERGREVNEFVRDVLGQQGMARSIIVAATSDMPALVKRRAAYLTLTIAEHFRDQGCHVLCLMDSLTRFAEAHREIALTAGELPALYGFPPSTFSEIAQLCERAGPGATSQGDITGLFTVLVSGGDADEPISDTARSVLDGHVVLSREIAERGRFPAIDLVQSVSRSLPAAASEEENALIREARRLLSLYRDLEPMVRLGAYRAGADPETDRAVALFPELDSLLGAASTSNAASFEKLKSILEGTEASGEGKDKTGAGSAAEAGGLK